ncbi:hypothetical protein HYV30_03390 [Candidatus Kaiserbacteria bacterium]|nr:hypothetical protein [Candidatus Kaiserbacteria bacterium]
MEKPKTTPKDFFFWLGAIVTFYWSVVAGILLIFDYINYAFPNPLAFFPADPYQSGISFRMASLIVLLPLSLVLFRLIHREERRDPTREDIWVRRWGLILTLFVAGAAIAADLITLLTTFLNGEELTLAFLLKVLAVLLIAAGVFMHFISELRGYWSRFPRYRRMVNSGVGVLAFIVVIAGFFIVGTPQQARLARFDAQKVNDLQNIQSQIIYFWQAKQALPSSLDELSDSVSLGGVPLPTDAQSGQPYGYQVTGTRSFRLCADFNAPSRVSPNATARPAFPEGPKGPSDNWQHGEGNICFDRIIDPSFYPPLSKNGL